MYRQLVYLSRARTDMTLREVYDIIRRSHTNNSRAGLTGALLYLDGYFLQLLEGPSLAVEDCYQRILSDSRHASIELRHEAARGERLFPDDWMALKSTAEVDESVLQRFGYSVGLPEGRFDGRQLVEFIQACFVDERISIVASQL